MPKIGFSLGRCVASIMDGEIQEDDVLLIIARTKVDEPDHWDRILVEDRERRWRNDPDRGEAIARRLLTAGKIVQPRLWGWSPPDLAVGPIWQDYPNPIVIPIVIPAPESPPKSA